MFLCLLAPEKKINYKSVAKLLVKFFLEKTIYGFVKEQMNLISRLVSADHFALGQTNNIPFKDILKEITLTNQNFIPLVILEC